MIDKENGRIHPSFLDDFHPQPFAGDGNSYGKSLYKGLHDDSSYAEYAWEFLRRNKCYQHSFDNPNSPILDINHWGFKSPSLSEATCGLITPKPYIERYGTGNRSEWAVLVDFRESLWGHWPPRSLTHLDQTSKPFNHSAAILKISLEHEFGENIDPISWQLAEIARRAREAQVAKNQQLVEVAACKSHLRKLLRLSDIESTIIKSKRNIELKTEKSTYTIMQKALNLFPRELLRSSDSRRAGPSKRKESSTELSRSDPSAKPSKSDDELDLKIISSLSIEAQKYIYRWRMLALLSIPEGKESYTVIRNPKQGSTIDP
ncbi:transcriptional regulator domain-containing protein [Inhella sp.]|uniref:transcriptional regulator domain-containing protein n=1 Tax=Inhella sp. TaxID=1921806 RepID=UPI0035B0CB7B